MTVTRKGMRLFRATIKRCYDGAYYARLRVGPELATGDIHGKQFPPR